MIEEPKKTSDLNSRFYVVDTNGRILRSGSAAERMIWKQRTASEALHIGKADPATQYHPPGEDLQDRPAMPVTLDKTAATIGEAITLSGVPIGASVDIGGEYHEAKEETIQIDFDAPGTYPVQIEAFPYLPWSSEIAID